MKFASEKRMELLPAGFRFFPTDEELITCYLARKAMDASFTSLAIRDVDLYKSEPWDLLPCSLISHDPGDHQREEGYFFCRRGSNKYPSGVRARRATRCGYWKSTGKDRAVHGGGGGDGRLVGTRKTLVFYRGRAPRGEKTGWVMHEYAMGERSSGSILLRGAQSEWVICKVFMRKHRTSDDSKVTSEETVHEEDSTPGHLLLPMAPDGSDGEQEAAVPLVVTDSLHTVSHSDGAHAMQMEPDDADYYLPELLDYDGCEDLPNAGLGLLEPGAEVNRRAEITSTAIGPLHLDGLYWKFGF